MATKTGTRQSVSARNRDMLLGLLEHEGYGWWQWDVESGKVNWSPEVYKIFGTNHFDDRIETFQKFIHPDDLAQAMARLTAAMQATGRVAGCFRITGDDQQIRLVYHSGKLVVDKKGKLSSVVGFFRPARNDETSAASLEATTPSRDSTRSGGRFIILRDKLYAARRSSDPLDREYADIGYLEFILTRLESAKDARILARRLFNRFGSFPKAIAAAKEDILQVEGCGPEHAALFDLVRAATQCLLQPRDEPISFKNPENLILYLRALQAYTDKEQFRVVFLNRANHIIQDELLTEGTVDFTPVFIRDIIKRALDLNSHSIVLVHNHPSGDPTPSVADVEMTHKIAKAAKAVGITVSDHLVLGNYGNVSFRNLGLLD